MENYAKGKNVDREASRETIPIDGLPATCKWMLLKPGTKLKNVVGVADRALKEEGAVLFSGSGAAVAKVVSCAEIVKRK
jgi:hypothetical protein